MGETKIGIDLFAGAGGLSLGARQAGIEIRYAVERDKYPAQTYRRNNPDTIVKCNDITEVDPRQLTKGEHFFIVIGGPPCQGFSLSNTRSRNMDNPKNHLFREFVRFVDVLRPDWFLLENVKGLTNMENGKTQEEIERCFEALGYSVKSKILWASDYGVPQHRNRFFLVGNRHGIDFVFPEKMNKTITVKDALYDLPELVNGQMEDELPYRDVKVSEYARLMRGESLKSTQNYVSRNNDLVIERYKYIRQGQNWQAIPEELMENYADKSRCHSGIYRRLREDKPSVVISNYRKSMLIHPTQDRGLSAREAARLQSFPDTFYFEGPHMSIQQQIGNAVPPLLAQAVIDKIMTYKLQ